MRSNKKILITGASGFIGNALFRELGEYAPIGLQNKSNPISGFLAGDLRDKGRVDELFARIKPEIVFHFAALTSPQRNEKDPELAFESHIRITENVLANLPDDAHIFFLSTDKVFDGTDPSPAEDAPTNPQCVYGRLKLQCEQMITGRLKRHHIIRIPIAHALGDVASPSFIDKALIELKAGRRVEVFDNVYRCYVTLQELLAVMIAMIDNTDYGIYHIGSAMASYAERIKRLCEEQNIDWRANLISKEGRALPMSQNLNSDKLKKTFGLVAR